MIKPKKNLQHVEKRASTLKILSNELFTHLQVALEHYLQYLSLLAKETRGRKPLLSFHHQSAKLER